jgi:hypothetical protein
MYRMGIDIGSASVVVALMNENTGSSLELLPVDHPVPFLSLQFNGDYNPVNQLKIDSFLREHRNLHPRIPLADFKTVLGLDDREHPGKGAGRRAFGSLHAGECAATFGTVSAEDHIGMTDKSLTGNSSTPLRT